jgi:hypothetical protein
MVTVMGMDCVIAPDVPVTVMVTWDVDGWDGWALLEEPPHPTAISEKNEIMRSNPNPPITKPRLRVSGLRLPVEKTVARSPRPGNKPPKIAAW